MTVYERLAALAARLSLPSGGGLLQDAHVYGGLALVYWGVAQLSPAWAKVVIGVALAAVGMFAQVRRSS